MKNSFDCLDQWSQGDGPMLVDANETFLFLDTDYVLATIAGGKLNHGEYHFPFSVEIPQGLPGCQAFHEPRGPRGFLYVEPPNYGSSFKIEYGLEARLHRSGVLKSDIVFALPIHVNHATVSKISCHKKK